MANVVFGAIGAWIAPSGYAALGYAIGSAAGTYLANSLASPLQLPDQIGPRLGDLAIQSSSLGNCIPVIHGYSKIAGNIIWMPELEEIRHEDTQEIDGGKGGSSGDSEVTTVWYTYKAYCAIALAAGLITSILRIWADDVLVYDIDTIVETKTVVGGVEVITTDILNTLHPRIYLGTEDQLPDALLESRIGVGMTPAFRGLAYVVFDGMPLEAYGNRLPLFSFEIEGI
jgi:hypothetical protein